MKFGIRAKLFVVSISLIFISVVSADIYLSRALNDERTQTVRDELFVRLNLVSGGVLSRADSIDDYRAIARLVDEASLLAQARVSLIRNDGRLIGDSDLDEAETQSAESHGDRPEVIAAKSTGRGESTRYSSTIQQRMMYVAAPLILKGQTVGVLRLARPLTEVDEAVRRLRRVVLAGSLLALIVAIAMSSLAAHYISRTLVALTDAAQRMAHGDVTVRLRASGDDELALLANALDRLTVNLSTSIAELRSERDLLNSVLNNMREGVLLVDRSGHVTLANPALRDFLLWPEDLAGKSPLELTRNVDLKEGLEKAGERTSALTTEIELTGATPRRLLMHATAMNDGPKGVLAVFVDVTELRRLESLRRDFVANVSHELRTPLATILSAGETLAEGAIGDPSSAQKFVQMIRQEAQRLSVLVEDLLELSRIEANKVKFKFESVPIEEVFRQVLSSFELRASERHVKLEINITPPGCVVRADRRALEQILGNLVDNAIKYAGPDAVVTLRAGASEKNHERVTISVEDSGPGIEAKHLPRLFERFYRVDSGRSRDMGGTGLGLAIVKHLVEAHQSSILVESVVGKGTKFVFDLSVS